MIRTFSELIRFGSFEDRFRYLSLKGSVGETTFGFDRYLNQRFYTSTQWRHVRNHIIARDEGCDLAVPGREIYEKIYIHHMNPMTKDQLVHGEAAVIDPEFLISTTHRTHNAIHYGDERQLARPYIPRRPGDTKLW